MILLRPRAVHAAIGSVGNTALGLVGGLSLSNALSILEPGDWLIVLRPFHLAALDPLETVGIGFNNRSINSKPFASSLPSLTRHIFPSGSIKSPLRIKKVLSKRWACETRPAEGLNLLVQPIRWQWRHTAQTGYFSAQVCRHVYIHGF